MGRIVNWFKHNVLNILVLSMAAALMVSAINSVRISNLADANCRALQKTNHALVIQAGDQAQTLVNVAIDQQRRAGRSEAYVARTRATGAIYVQAAIQAAKLRNPDVKC